MRARMESLDMLANNLANASASGFKADRESYSTYISSDALTGDGPASSLSPVVDRRWTDFSQGTFAPTGNSLDFALDGDGFFAVRAKSGEMYTRCGSFHLDAAGILLNREGDTVENTEGKPIRLNPTSPVEVSESGEIRQAGITVGQLRIVRFDAPQALSKQGRNSYRLSVSDLQPVSSDARVYQGVLEGANIQPAEMAVRLVSVLRQFEMLQKAVSLGNQMNQRAIQEVAHAAS